MSDAGWYEDPQDPDGDTARRRDGEARAEEAEISSPPGSGETGGSSGSLAFFAGLAAVLTAVVVVAVVISSGDPGGDNTPVTLPSATASEKDERPHGDVSAGVLQSALCADLDEAVVVAALSGEAAAEFGYTYTVVGSVSAEEFAEAGLTDAATVSGGCEIVVEVNQPNAETAETLTLASGEGENLFDLVSDTSDFEVVVRSVDVPGAQRADIALLEFLPGVEVPLLATVEVGNRWVSVVRGFSFSVSVSFDGDGEEPPSEEEMLQMQKEGAEKAYEGMVALLSEVAAKTR